MLCLGPRRISSRYPRDVATKQTPPRPDAEQNGQEPREFDRFKRLTKKLVSVPRKEIERQAAKKKAG